MCLNVIDDNVRQKTYGYKVFRLKRGRLYPVYRGNSTANLKTYPFAKWFQDQTRYVQIGFAMHPQGYLTGFHFYYELAGAKELLLGCPFSGLIRKVLVKDIVASGIQDGYSVGVARSIFILPQEV